MTSIPKDPSLSWLQTLARRELQILAKKHSIRANKKSDVLRQEIKKLITEKEGTTTKEQEETSSPTTHGETESSSSSGNTPETSPESDPRNQNSPLRRVAFTIPLSVGNTVEKLPSQLSEIPPRSPSIQADQEESNESLVQDLNATRFDDESHNSYFHRFNLEESSFDDESTRSSNGSDTQSTGDGIHGTPDGSRVETDQDVFEIMDGMNQLTLSVDLDGDDARSEERATDLPPLRELRFQFPPGGVGLILKKDEYGNTEVQEVKQSCPLRDYIIRGDVLVSVDDRATRKIRLDAVVDIVMERSLYSRWFCFGRNVAKSQDPRAESRRQGMSTSVPSAARTVRPASSIHIPSNIQAAIAHAAIEKKNSKTSHQGLHVGSRAFKFAHMKGREAEKARRLFAERFLKWCTMVTPLPMDDNGNPTDMWEPIVPFLVVLDPFKATPINGGKRVYGKNHLRDRRKVVMLVEAEKFQLTKAVMKDLLANNFESSEHLEVDIVSCTEDFMQSTNGNRTEEKASTPNKPHNQPIVHLGATPAPFQ